MEVADWHTYLVGQWLLIVHNGPCEDALKWTIGAYDELTKKAAGLALDAHHLVQAEKMSALLKKTGQTFDHGKGISILVPTIGHRRRDLVDPIKCISRWNGKKVDKISSGKVHATNVTPEEAFQKLMEWHKSKSTGSCP